MHLCFVSTIGGKGKYEEEVYLFILFNSYNDRQLIKIEEILVIKVLFSILGSSSDQKYLVL